MTLHLKSRGYPFRPRLLFSCFIVVGVGFPNCVLFQERTRNEQILRNFEIILPKFHFILPNFYFPAPWRICVSSLEIPDFLGRVIIGGP